MYNATVYTTRNGQPWGTFVAEVAMIGGTLQMLRGNGVSCTGYEGKVAEFKPGTDLAAKYPGERALYDVFLREREPDSEFRIVLDDCAGYKNLLGGLNLPPAYLGEGA